MIGFEEVSKEREKKLVILKKDIAECKLARDMIDTAHCTLKIKYERMEETNTTLHFNYDDVVDKLHIVNKARYQLETELTDVHQANKNLKEIMAVQSETLVRRQTDIEELEKRVIERDRELEGIEIKKQGVEK